MNTNHFPKIAALAAALLLILSTASFAADSLQTAQPFVKQLPADSIHYTPLAETEAFESGCVSLLPGNSGSEHSTQEMLIILKGQGEVIIVGGDTLQFHAGEVAYVPSNTKHQIRCTGDTALQYVYVAAKATP
jgi:quercetin dioxygenase-like cupin family protein